jgi:lysophospholipase L1-like esterase
MTKSVLIIGHSFVSRLKQDIRDGFIGDNNLGLNSANQAVVFFHGRGGMLSKHLHSELSFIQDLQPHVIFIEIGTNDLDSNIDPSIVSDKIVQFVLDLCKLNSITKVFISQIINRDLHGSSIDNFNDQSIKFTYPICS